jgi:hypothetical protein
MKQADKEILKCARALLQSVKDAGYEIKEGGRCLSTAHLCLWVFEGKELEIDVNSKTIVSGLLDEQV